MITGYNTDVRHGNRVFHVQTEDKGLSNPKIETLIYVGGEILDSYRSSYEDLTVAPPVTESVIQSRMDEQHRAVIRDIKNGKYDLTPPDLLEQQAFNDRPLDQAILEFLQQEGDVLVQLCQSQSPVSGAEVSVKLVSSLKKATGLLSGKTGVDGSYEGEVQLPPSQPGQCAVVVTRISDQGFDEVKTTVLAS